MIKLIQPALSGGLEKGYLKMRKLFKHRIRILQNLTIISLMNHWIQVCLEFGG